MKTKEPILLRLQIIEHLRRGRLQPSSSGSLGVGSSPSSPQLGLTRYAGATILRRSFDEEPPASASQSLWLWTPARSARPACLRTARAARGRTFPPTRASFMDEVGPFDLAA